MENQIEDQAKKYNTSLRAQSRRNWGRKMIDGIPTDEQLAAGALMRIADSLDKDESISDIRDLARVGTRFLRMRGRTPKKDQFHFTFEQPAQEPRFLSVTSAQTGKIVNICISKISIIAQRATGGTAIFIDGINDGFVCEESADVVMKKIQKP